MVLELLPRGDMNIVIVETVEFIKNWYHIETRQTVCIVNQMTGLCMIRIITEKHFRGDFKF